MTSLRIFALAALTCGAMALSIPVQEAQKIRIVEKKATSNNGLGGGGSENADTPANEGESPRADLENPPERETFSSLVIADLPRPIGFELSGLAKGVSESTGVEFEPSWFRVDMARFTSAKPFNGKEVAAKLGLKIIANYSNDLILAAEESAAAQRAEARLFLYHLMENRERRIWEGAILANDGNGRSRNMARTVVFVGGGRIVPAKKEPEKAKDAESVRGPFKDLAENEVFANTGPLNDPRVMNALGLVAEDLDYPLSLRYPISSFSLKGPKQSNYYDEYYDYSYDYNPFDPFSGLPKLSLDRSRSGSLTIRAHTGTQSENPPYGPSANLLETNIFNPYARMSSIRSSSYRYNYYEEQKKETESPHFVSLKVEGFDETFIPEASKLAVFEQQVEQSIALKDRELFKLAQSSAMLYGRRTLTPRNFVWTDSGATNTVVDPVDTASSFRQNKRMIVAKAVEILRQWARSRKDTAPTYGNCGSDEVMEAYGMDYDSMNGYYYNAYSMRFDKPAEASLAKEAIVLRTNAENLDKRQLENLAFAVRINFETGDVLWLEGEPESEESLAGRRRELRECAEVITSALPKLGDGQMPDQEWVRATFQNAARELLWTSISDYQVVQILKGYYRVIADDPGSVFTQRALFSVASGRVTWETLKEPTLVEENDYGYDEKW